MKRFVYTLVALLIMTGCSSMTPVQRGASAGALAGGLVGGVWGHAARGITAAQGAGLGAMAGGLVGALAADSLTQEPGYGKKDDAPVVTPPPAPAPPKRYRTVEK
jgi:outer membrane lipoprotein SlyB